MGTLYSKAVELRQWWLEFSSESHDQEKEDNQKQFERAVVNSVEQGDLKALQSLHEQGFHVFWGGVDIVNPKPPLLHRAVSNGHRKITEYLIQLGVDVDDVDSSGMTALHEACKKQVNSCIPLLLSHCRDIDRRDVWGRTPLIKALVYRNMEAAEMLLEMGANPNAIDIYGMTPLSTAIDYNLIEMLRVLVHHGADVNLLSQNLYRYIGPPLYLAINNHNLPLVNELLRLGATTQPRVEEYRNSGVSNYSPWPHRNIVHHLALTPNLQHSNAVILAMSELIKRDTHHPYPQTANITNSKTGVDLLMAVLSAHGHPLGSSPDVLIRVLINSRPEEFSMLLQKLQVCSSNCSEDLMTLTAASKAADSMQNPNNMRQVKKLLWRPPRNISSLQNQARRAARKALMSSTHNVVWASERLQCPPALKSLLLLRDIDRAYAAPDLSIIKLL